MSTQEKNKMIAEYMGLVIITDDISFFDTNYKPLARYDKSWEALMPVVEKISKNYSYYCSNDSGDWQVLIDIYGINIVGVNIREVTYKAVVEFIQCYNKSKNDKA